MMKKSFDKVKKLTSKDLLPGEFIDVNGTITHVSSLIADLMSNDTEIGMLRTFIDWFTNDEYILKALNECIDERVMSILDN